MSSPGSTPAEVAMPDPVIRQEIVKFWFVMRHCTWLDFIGHLTCGNLGHAIPFSDTKLFVI